MARLENIMFCSSCGKGEQTPESYCRSCGEFLADVSGKSYLLNKLLGGSKPETQVTVNLLINLVTAVVSISLLGFLNGYYAALRMRTQESPPTIIYLVYAFLGLVAIWQIFSFLIGLRLRAKFKGRTRDEAVMDSILKGSETRQHSLPEPSFESPATRATEDKTRLLDRVPRK